MEMAPDTDFRQMLDALDQDRVRLSERVGMPTWLAPTVAFLTAAWVASPVIGNQSVTYAYPISLGGIVLVIYLAAHTAGVRHGRLRGRAYWIVGAATAIGLVLYSTSLGLVSFDLRWWVILPALATTAVGYSATRLVERESLARVTRGR
jgi:ribose/xylose/arabinose/galactoside ABC-type transport system permease subunit